jgi:hypothetical protein
MEGLVRARVAASVALAALLTVGVAGCNFVTPQATEKHYDASDGVSGSVGDVKVLNVMAIASDKKATADHANLVFTAVNNSEDTVRLRVQYKSKTQTVELEPGATDIGYGKKADQRLQLSGFTAKPGALAKVFFQYGSQEGQQLEVPVLDTTWAMYSDLGPTATPTPKPTATATSTPGATDTPNPTDTSTPNP